MFASNTQEATVVLALQQCQLWQGSQPNSTWKAHFCRGATL